MIAFPPGQPWYIDHCAGDQQYHNRYIHWPGEDLLQLQLTIHGEQDHVQSVFSFSES